MSTVDTAYDLSRKVQELERELGEARQQQVRISDILRIISGSTSDITRVFDAIARSAARLCEAFDVIVLRVDGDVLRLVAHYGPMPTMGCRSWAPRINTTNARACANFEQYYGKVVHGVDSNIAIDAFRFPKNAAIASVEVAAKEASSSGPFSLKVILFGKWTD